MIHPERELLQDTGQKTVPETKKRKKKAMKSYLPIAVAFAGVLFLVGYYAYFSFYLWHSIGVAALKILFLPVLYLICRRLKCEELRIIHSLQIVCWIVVIEVMLLNILQLARNLNFIDLYDFYSIVGGGVEGTNFLGLLYSLIKNRGLDVPTVLFALNSACMVLSYGLCLIGFTQAKWEIYGRSNARGSMDVL